MERAASFTPQGASSSPTSVCALPSPLSARKAIAFVGPRLLPWAAYHAQDGNQGNAAWPATLAQTWKSYSGGEAYWAASLEFILTRILGFRVDWIPSQASLPNWAIGKIIPDASLLGKDASTGEQLYHRFILDSSTSRKLRLLLQERTAPADLCRMRVLDFWGAWSTAEAPGLVNASAAVRAAVDERWVVTPYHCIHNAPLPFFVHSLVTLPPSTQAARPRAGFILGKACSLFKADQRASQLVAALHSRGFKLHATADCAIGVPLVVHGLLAPTAFAAALRGVAFVLGLGAPCDSPTPLEGLANGAAFLNPWLEKHECPGSGPPPRGVSRRAQHRPLSSLGAPYVYSYDRNVPNSLVAAAESAIARRFASFVPAAHRLEGAVAAVCANLLQHDSLCVSAAAAEANETLVDAGGSFNQEY